MGSAPCRAACHLPADDPQWRGPSGAIAAWQGATPHPLDAAIGRFWITTIAA
jgi:hypothetical protein